LDDRITRRQRLDSSVDYVAFGDDRGNDLAGQVGCRTGYAFVRNPTFEDAGGSVLAEVSLERGAQRQPTGISFRPVWVGRFGWAMIAALLALVAVGFGRSDKRGPRRSAPGSLPARQPRPPRARNRSSAGAPGHG
jgi:hypothetical protein